MTPILEDRGLTKHFGRTQALAGLDLVVNPGRVVALLGPNGAGKTTFIRAVATLLRPDTGTLYVAGIDALRQPAQVRQIIGLAGEFAAVEQAMTGRDNLEMVGRLFGLSFQQARAAATAVRAAPGGAGRPALARHGRPHGDHGEVAEALVENRRTSVLVTDEEGRPLGRIGADDVVDALLPERGRLHFPRLLH